MADESRDLARYVREARWSDLPEQVRHEGRRAFLNWVGCAFGGARHPAVDALLATVTEFAGKPQATVLARSERLDIVNAALINGLSASAYCYDDTELDTIAHPTAAAAAALLALAERQRISGVDFILALILANEVQCRLATALAVSPARCHVGLYMTGYIGAPGIALAVGKLLGLNEQQMVWALGTGACQGAGFRATHASMCSGVIPAYAGRNGLLAGLMAAHDFSCSEHSLEGRNGFLDVFGSPANPAALTDGLGTRYAAMAVAAKPYPSGCFIHPTIDACLELAAADWSDPEQIERVDLTVHPLGLGLTGGQEPKTAYDAQVSVYHWAAAALVHRRAGLEQTMDACVTDPAVVALRQRVRASADETLGPDEARVVLVLKDGRTLRAHVRHCLGSAARPMTDAELEEKFLGQTQGIIPEARAKQLIGQCWAITESDDVSRLAPGVWG